MLTYADFEIDIPPGRLDGQVYTICPKCSHDRKKKRAKCLGVNLDKGIWHCSHCSWKGSLYKKQYKVPVWENKTQLPDEMIEWFLKRNISQKVVNDMKISCADVFMPQLNANKKCICFNYFRSGKLVNIKYRDSQKNFRMYKDAELIVYNLDAIHNQKEIIITEGECDTMVLVQAGIESSCSVPNGANTKLNNLDYIDNCWQSFELAETIYIATDNDGPGNQLADELARRFGVERCYRVNLDPHKDVNDALNAGEKISMDWIKEKSTPYPLTGIFKAEKFWSDMLHIRAHGFPKGWKPRHPLSNNVTFHPGHTTLITGIPSHGKSEFLDQILLEISIDNNIRGCYFSPENYPTSTHLIKLAEKIIGKNFWELHANEINSIQQWVNENIYWVYPDDGFDLTNILAHVRKAVKKYGINWYVIDPWNKVDHQFTGPETAYISRVLDEIDLFNKTNNVHAFIVAHPTKMEKDKDGKYVVPNLYSVSGSAHFFNKIDIGMTVYKEGQGQTSLHIQKVKFKYWGEVGMINYIWDARNGRYYTTNNSFTSWIGKEADQDLFSEPKTIEEDDIPF